MKVASPGYFGKFRREFHAVGLCAFESVYEAGLTLPRHAHAQAHLCLVLSGIYSETLGGVAEPRGPLTLIYYPPNCPHAETHKDAGRHFLVEWGQSWLNSALRDARLPDRPLVLDRGPWACVTLKAYRSLLQSDPTSALDIEHLSLELLAAICDFADRERLHFPSWLERAIEFLDESFDMQPSLVEIADAVHVHPCHLARAFRRWTGGTVGDMRRRLQIEHACRRLLSSRDPLSFIATDAGFSDQSHLTRLVRAATGFTPEALRASVLDSA